MKRTYSNAIYASCNDVARKKLEAEENKSQIKIENIKDLAVSFFKKFISRKKNRNPKLKKQSKRKNFKK